MDKRFIKKLLFAIVGLSAVPGLAQEAAANKGLTLIEDLPIEQRTVIHEQVVNYLAAHPEQAAQTNVIAVDEEGKVYVLDKNLVQIQCLGEPSCVTM